MSKKCDGLIIIIFFLVIHPNILNEKYLIFAYISFSKNILLYFVLTILLFLSEVERRGR